MIGYLHLRLSLDLKESLVQLLRFIMEALHSMILDCSLLLKFRQMNTRLKVWDYFQVLVKITISVFQEDSEKLLRFISSISLRGLKLLCFLLTPIMAQLTASRSVQERTTIQQQEDQMARSTSGKSPKAFKLQELTTVSKTRRKRKRSTSTFFPYQHQDKLSRVLQNA